MITKTMQTLTKNRNFILIRDEYETADEKNFYCSKLYKSHEVKFKDGNISGECVKDENGNDIYCLELTERGLEHGFKGEAIPQGIFKIKRDRTGKFKWFKLINDDLLKDNEKTKAIEIHHGNYLKDTEGCLLFGIGFDPGNLYGSEDIIIQNSKNTCNYLLDCVFGNPSKKDNQIIGNLEIITLEKYREKILIDLFKS